MPHSRFPLLLLLSSLLFLSFHHGFGRPAMMEIQNLQTVSLSAEGVPIRKTVKYEIEDYADPQPNINPKNGYIFTPPAQTPTHPPRP